MIVLGIDPDTKTTGLGLVRDGRAIHARLISVDNRRAKMDTRRTAMASQLVDTLQRWRVEQPEADTLDAIVIEGQRIRPRHPRPQDLIHLAHVTGMLVSLCYSLWPTVPIYVPEPSEWKGSVKKEVFTRRILRELDLEHAPNGGLHYKGSRQPVRVPGTPGLNKTDSSHVIDGLGLALWGYRQLPLRSRRLSSPSR